MFPRAAGASMNVEPVFEPDRLVAALNAAQIEYVVVGGLAVGAHGVVRASLLSSPPASYEARGR